MTTKVIIIIKSDFEISPGKTQGIGRKESDKNWKGGVY